MLLCVIRFYLKFHFTFKYSNTFFQFENFFDPKWIQSPVNFAAPFILYRQLNNLPLIIVCDGKE